MGAHFSEKRVRYYKAYGYGFMVYYASVQHSLRGYDASLLAGNCRSIPRSLRNARDACAMHVRPAATTRRAALPCSSSSCSCNCCLGGKARCQLLGAIVNRPRSADTACWDGSLALVKPTGSSVGYSTWQGRRPITVTRPPRLRSARRSRMLSRRESVSAAGSPSLGVRCNVL